MLYSAFKNGAARSVFAGLGKDWAAIMDEARSFEELRLAIVKRNDRGVGGFAQAVRQYAGVCSSGEYRLLLALCSFADFSHIADQMAAGTAWQNIVRGCDLKFRAAIAACIENSP